MMSQWIRQMSLHSTASAAAMKLVAVVTSWNTRARQSWYVFTSAKEEAPSLTLWSQLDAGMHPAKEGFSALPFFDEFDLSTVDVLLISQYVQFLFCFYNHAWTSGKRQSPMTALDCRILSRVTHPSSSHTRYLKSPIQFNATRISSVLLYLRSFEFRIICTIHYHAAPHGITANCTTSIVSTSIILPHFHMSSARPISKEGSS